jgi:uncharacterized glyoxalase superfamily metalloenzyme YdcJ
MYGTEVPTYTTLVDISSKVNCDCLAINQGREPLGSLDG